MPRLIRYCRWLYSDRDHHPGDILTCSRGRRYVVGPAGNLVRMREAGRG